MTKQTNILQQQGFRRTDWWAKQTGYGGSSNRAPLTSLGGEDLLLLWRDSAGTTLAVDWPKKK